MNPISSINHITILVKNRNRAKRFYTEVLGLKEVRIGKSVWIRVGDQYLHLTETSGKPVTSTFYHFALVVKNLKLFSEKLQQKKIVVFNLDKELNEVPISLNKKQQFFIKDPDGNLIELVDSKNQFFFQ